ncbi:MAG: CsbD family protein [Prolixibacteraceae bacterium]|nr:CsbD family protein [Prolixibacteraceae bacterium]
MNTIEENGNLLKLNGALKQKFARLTNDDQLYLEGKQQEVFGKLQVRYGKTEEELDMIIATL